MKKILILTIYLIVGVLLFGSLSVVQAEECIECEIGALSEQEARPEIDPNSSLYQRFIFTLPGGHVAAGVGMRNRGYGDITISGIPSGSTIEAAYLYWDILDNVEYPSFAQGKINGVFITGTKIGEGPDPCWAPTKNFVYRTEVTNLVTGNGIYSLTDFVSGKKDGCDPWTQYWGCSDHLPLIEGASLVVIYRNPTLPWQTIVIYDGAETLIATSYSHTITGFTTSSPVTNAFITYLGADGQNSGAGEDTYFNGVRIGYNDWDGSDPHAGPFYSRGNLWDTNTYDVTSLVSPGDTSVIAEVRSMADCLVWVATVFSISVTPPTRIFSDKAKELAKEIIDAPYHKKMYEPSTKGFVWEKDKGYYFFTPEQVKLGYPEKKPGLDCSGLSFWSYNRAYYGDGHEKKRENFPIRWEGANGQYNYNVDKINKEELKPGDLLFFDEYPVNDNIR